MRGVIHPYVQYPAEPLKTEISRTAIPIAASMALELSGNVARWPGETARLRAYRGFMPCEPWCTR